MQQYRAFRLGLDGHVTFRFDPHCADDDAAKKRAKQLAKGHVIELWQEDRSSQSASKAT